MGTGASTSSNSRNEKQFYDHKMKLSFNDPVHNPSSFPDFQHDSLSKLIDETKAKGKETPKKKALPKLEAEPCVQRHAALLAVDHQNPQNDGRHDNKNLHQLWTGNGEFQEDHLGKTNSLKSPCNQPKFCSSPFKMETSNADDGSPLLGLDLSRLSSPAVMMGHLSNIYNEDARQGSDDVSEDSQLSDSCGNSSVGSLSSNAGEFFEADGSELMPKITPLVVSPRSNFTQGVKNGSVGSVGSGYGSLDSAASNASTIVSEYELLYNIVPAISSRSRLAQIHLENSRLEDEVEMLKRELSYLTLLEKQNNKLPTINEKQRDEAKTEQPISQKSKDSGTPNTARSHQELKNHPLPQMSPLAAKGNLLMGDFSTSPLLSARKKSADYVCPVEPVTAINRKDRDSLLDICNRRGYVSPITQENGQVLQVSSPPPLSGRHKSAHSLRRKATQPKVQALQIKEVHVASSPQLQKPKRKPPLVKHRSLQESTTFQAGAKDPSLTGVLGQLELLKRNMDDLGQRKAEKLLRKRTVSDQGGDEKRSEIAYPNRPFSTNSPKAPSHRKSSPRSKKHSRIRTKHQPCHMSPNTTVPSEEASLESFDLAFQQFAEVQFVLKRPLRTETDLAKAMKDTEEALKFMDQLQQKASEMDVLQGSLCRWILPLDTNTPVLGQNSVLQAVLDQVPVEFKGKISLNEVYYYVENLNRIRSLIKMKILDDNDLKTAKSALLILMNFFSKLLSLSEQKSETPFKAFIHLQSTSDKVGTLVH